MLIVLLFRNMSDEWVTMIFGKVGSDFSDVKGKSACQ